MHQRQPPVVFVHAGLEQAHHVESFQPRQHPGRSHVGLRGNDRHLVAQPHAQRVGQLLAEHDAKLAGAQIVQRSLHHLAADVRHLPFLRRQNTLNQRAADQRGVVEHRLAPDVGRAALDLGIAQRLFAHRRPIVHQAIPAAEGSVGGHRQNAPAQFLLEAVHHRQDGDQRGDAQRDAEHGGQGNEGNEVIAALGAGVAQADEQFQGTKHGRDSNWRQRSLPESAPL